MQTRTVMIFPQFENMGVIGGIRDKYDPLATLVRPHVTLVFPFESDLLARELARCLTDRRGTVSNGAGRRFNTSVLYRGVFRYIPA